jgi:VWFA-related protein
MSFADMVWVRDGLRKFVNEQMQEGDFVAIIRVSGGVGALQQFTNDKRLLLASIDKVKYNMGASNVGTFDPASTTMPDMAHKDDPSAPGFMDRMARDKVAQLLDLHCQMVAAGTLGALSFIVKGMGELPGRKSVMLFSDGLSMPGPGSPCGPEAFKRVIDVANRNSVVFYTIDARGLLVAMIEAQDDVNATEVTRGGTDLIRNIREAQIHSGQDGLRYLAEETGGLAAINDNSIPHAIRRVLEDESYYLVAYTPNDETFDAKKARFNQLDVKVTRPGVKVRVRSGFYSVATEETVNKEDPTAAIIHAITSPLNANDITVNMNALFVAGPKGTANVHTFVNVDPRDITFVETSDGRHAAVFDVFALTFGLSGNAIDQKYSRSAVLVDDAEYERIKQRGLISDYTVPLKKPGAYQVRIAIRDKSTGRLGSASQFIMIPDVRNHKLAVSGAVLANLPIPKEPAAPTFIPAFAADPRVATPKRQFIGKSVLRYDYYVYNAQLNAERKAQLTYRTMLYRDDKVIFQDDERTLDVVTYEPGGEISTRGVLQLGNDLPAGDYVLRVQITDQLAKGKNRSVDQFIQFEIVE